MHEHHLPSNLYNTILQHAHVIAAVHRIPLRQRTVSRQGGKRCRSWMNSDAICFFAIHCCHAWMKRCRSWMNSDALFRTASVCGRLNLSARCSSQAVSGDTYTVIGPQRCTTVPGWSSPPAFCTITVLPILNHSASTIPVLQILNHSASQVAAWRGLPEQEKLWRSSGRTKEAQVPSPDARLGRTGSRSLVWWLQHRDYSA